MTRYEDRDVTEISEALELNYEDKERLAERVYDFIKKEENIGIRITSGVGDFKDTNWTTKNRFIEIINLVVGESK